VDFLGKLVVMCFSEGCGGWQMGMSGEGYDMLFKGNANRNIIKK